jgi:predicted nucleotidyltransferase component of viral defense system
LYWNTVSDLLKKYLLLLMNAPEFSKFRLVGGTALSLHLGHRQSVDIDLFTDAKYGTIDFEALEKFLKEKIEYVDTGFGLPKGMPVGMGKSYLIGESKNNTVKLDVFYTDQFIDPPIIKDGIRLATIGEITAMKIDVISRKGRKKDFWDIHELLGTYTVKQMLNLHKQRYPYSHEESEILTNFIDFSEADDDFDPICLRGKHWELIKLDIVEKIEGINK